ncbi:MAG: phytoene desaturase [Okeania sp. SIO3C4]|nr:phytoene desaturase [Okeania sp. SIO3C4]
MSKSVTIVGAGFSGLAAAAHLAKAGHKVTLLEKNPTVGGRARQLKEDGYTFDMGPSWYWMPDVFESFFAEFNKKPSDYYHLIRLDPSYSVYFGQDDRVDLSADLDGMMQMFEKLEPGSSVQLKKFLDEGSFKYDVGVNKMVYKPGLSVFEFLDWELAKGVMKLHVFQSISKYIRNHFKNPKLVQLLEFPVLFLGAMPQDTPALYSLMNYADIQLGTWYPQGGMYKVIEALASLCEELGVDIRTGSEVLGIETQGNLVKTLHTTTGDVNPDSVMVSGDYHHFEQNIIPKQFRRYTPQYWDSRDMAPGSLLFFLGFDKKLENIEHHTLFFDTDFNAHAEEIYKNPAWPKDPLFYLSAASKTDPDAAPEGHEAVVILIPLAPGLPETENVREMYLDMVLTRLEKLTGQSVKGHLKYKRSYAHREFIRDYHAYKGNAYGLANTLKQTAILKPSIKR